jgi:hypothetical protein
MERSDLLADKRIPKLNLNAEVTQGRVARPFLCLQLKIGHSWILPLHDLSFVKWVWHFRVADPFGL